MKKHIAFTMRNNVVDHVRDVSGHARAVLHVLLRFWNDESCTVWCAQHTIAEASGFGERTVRDALKELRDAGYLVPAGEHAVPRGSIPLYRFGRELDAHHRHTAPALKADHRHDVPPVEARPPAQYAATTGTPCRRPPARGADKQITENRSGNRSLVAVATNGVGASFSSRKIVEHFEALFVEKKGRGSPTTAKVKNAKGAKAILVAVREGDVTEDGAREAVTRAMNDPWTLQHQPNLAYIAANLEKYVGEASHRDEARGRSREVQATAADEDAPWRKAAE